MTPMVFALAAALLQLPAPARPVPPPPPQDLTLPPESAQLVTILEGRGVQTYTCAANPGPGPAFHWLFQAPKADLYNLATGKAVGHHDAGPAWTLDDGSAIQGTVLQQKLATNPTDVPWLLLKTSPVVAAKPSVLSPVAYVRRFNTHGGAPPAPSCAAEQQGQSVAVPYSSTYAFYSAPGTPSLNQGFGSPLPAPPPAPQPPPAP